MVWIVLVAAALSFWSCSRINQENYDKIEVGMTYDAVVDILGTPDETKNVIGTKSCVWGQAPETIRIKFIADKVIFHSAQGLQ